MIVYLKYLTSWLLYRVKGGIPMPPSIINLNVYQDWHLYGPSQYYRVLCFRKYWIALIEADELDNLFDMKNYNYKRFSIRYNQ